MDVQVRSATDADGAFLVRLARDAYRDLVTQQFGTWDDADQGRRFAAKVARVPFRIAEMDGEAVAAISSSEHDDHVFLNELLVMPALQNRGIGSRLLVCEIAYATALRKPLRLHTLRLNRAIRFYERHGFLVTARGDVYVDMERAG